MGGNEEKAHPLSVEGTGHMVQDAGCRAHPLSVEPPCAMKPGMTRCMRAPAYLRASKREYERRRQRESEIERARAQSERERDRESAERERERERERESESERERERERSSFIQSTRVRHPKCKSPSRVCPASCLPASGGGTLAEQLKVLDRLRSDLSEECDPD